MVVVEPVVNEEKLRQLLDEAHESSELDYKGTLDLDTPGDVIELAKDIGAMQVDGGFIVVGADDHGIPTGQCPPNIKNRLDESRLRQKLLKYLPAPITLRTAVHVVNGVTVGLIYVGPNPSGFAIFSKLGQYNKPGQKDPECVFRPGDVFVRHGTSSERWTQVDIDRILKRTIAAHKEGWRREFADDYHAVQVGREGQELARAPAEALRFQLDEASFRATLIEQLRSGDDVPLKLLLERARRDARERYHAAGAGDEELQTIVDRLACVAAIVLVLGNGDQVAHVVRSLLSIYELGFDLTRSDGATLWFAIVKRVFLLGAMAVRHEDWALVRRLATTHGQSDNWRYYKTWVRHGQIESAQSGLMGPSRGPASISLIAEARALAADHPCLRSDVAPDDDALLASLCQFDALAGLAAMDDIHLADTRAFYTNFARFWNQRTEPALIRLIQDPDMRAALFHGDDEQLAVSLGYLDHVARNEGFSYSGWEGFRDDRILDFIRAHTKHA
jgi:hypothetical protein